MGLSYQNLDEVTRRFMIDEIDIDVRSGTIYLSSYLNSRGCEAWPRILREAAEQGTDDTLAQAIRNDQCLKNTTERKKPKGGFTTVQVPVTAAETMAEAEFNRFYTRGLCRRALEEGVSELEAYRAKPVREPRPETERKIGGRFNADAVLADLRKEPKDQNATLGFALPNSGLALRLPC